MSRKMKVIVSVVVAVLLLTVGGTATVMAQDKPVPTPEPSTKIFMVTANTTGLLARVAEILDIPEDDLVNAFNQARQEMREEAYLSFLDKAVAEGLLTQEEADEIEEWWQQKPEALEQGLLRHACGFKAMRGEQMPGNRLGVRAEIGPQPWQEMNQQAWQGMGQQPWQAIGQQARQAIRQRACQVMNGELQ